MEMDLELDWRLEMKRGNMGTWEMADPTAEAGHLQSTRVHERCDICRSNNASNDWQLVGAFHAVVGGRASLDVEMSLIFFIFSHVDE